MPVYIRKNVNFTPPSLDKIPLEDEDDYITDPDQLKDRLPQPYRMIDKVLTAWYDEVWSIIEKRENDRIEESRKIRAPQYECSLQMKNHGRACCICDSVDGRYIFIGLPRGVAAIDAMTQEKIANWEEENVDIHYIKAYLIGVQIYLVVTIDDMGFARLLIFGGDKFYFAKILNEFQAEEGGTKLLVSKCEASHNGDYLGAVFENPETAEVWLEVHRLPRDTWLNELESVIQVKKEDKKDDEPGGDTMANTEQEVTTQPTEVEAPPVTQDFQYSRKSKSQEDAQGDKNVPKLSPTTLVMKMKPPPSMSGNTSTSLHSACQKIDLGEVIGTGINHILTPSHKELRKDVFNHLHDNLIDYLPKNSDDLESLEEVTFHFMTAGRLVPTGMEQPSQTEDEEDSRRIPTTLAVWWKGSSHLMQYSLLKQHKEFDVKADLVWPYTSNITSSAVSEDTSLIAIGFENGNVVIWDRYLGIQRNVINIREDTKIETLTFLNPSICPQIQDDYRPYRSKVTTYLLIMCSDGSMYVMVSGQSLEPDPICISPPIEKEDDMLTMVHPVPGMPDLLITVLKSGKIEIRDTLQGKVICEPVLPKTHELMTPWDPVVAAGGMGQILYIKGNGKEFGEDSGDKEESAGALFVYQLKSFPTLDTFMTKKREDVPFMVHPKIENRIEALMKERIAQQGLRKTRMQERWGYLKEEIWSIMQYKDQAERKADNRPEVHYKSVRNFSM